jgi:hypothetical protein
VTVDNVVRSQLVRLFRSVRPGWASLRAGPTYNAVSHAGAFHLEGEGYELMRSLRKTLSSPALGGEGFSTVATRALLGRACRVFLDKGEGEAIAFVQLELDTPPSSWEAFRRIDVAHVPAGGAQFGQCLLIGSLGANQSVCPGDFVANGGPWVTTTVVARDEYTAAVLADQAFGETAALLETTAGGGQALIDSRLVLIRTDGRVVDRPRRRMPVRLGDWVDLAGNPVPPFYQMATAASKATRTEWEQRVLAASRWYSAGIASPWPSQALVTFMNALEALFIDKKGEPKKGATIAERGARLVLIPGTDEIERRKWLGDLYRQRNSAIHQGLEYRNEIEVDSLSDFTLTAIAWAAEHLDPEHRDPPASCTTADEVWNRCPTVP